MIMPVNFKEDSPDLYRQWLDLPDRNPRHHALVSTAAIWSWALFGKPLVLTSIWRPDDRTSVHAYWRGTDCRIWHPERLVESDELEGLQEHEAVELAQKLNRTFRYDNWRQVAIIHGDGFHRHVHLQTPEGQFWS